jgi:hypothetical protein
LRHFNLAGARDARADYQRVANGVICRDCVFVAFCDSDSFAPDPAAVNRCPF